EPQVFELLAYLIGNNERVVGKDELLAAVWEGRIVSESAMTTRINAARAAVGDNGHEQRLIKTVRRRGLRFVAAVQKIEAGHSPRRGINKPSLAVQSSRSVGWDPAERRFAGGLVEQVASVLCRYPWLVVSAHPDALDRQGALPTRVRYLLRVSVRKSAST